MVWNFFLKSEWKWHHRCILENVRKHKTYLSNEHTVYCFELKIVKTSQRNLWHFKSLFKWKAWNLFAMFVSVCEAFHPTKLDINTQSNIPTCCCCCCCWDMRTKHRTTFTRYFCCFIRIFSREISFPILNIVLFRSARQTGLSSNSVLFTVRLAFSAHSDSFFCFSINANR